MSVSNKGLHLTLDERIIIETSISKGLTKTSIAESLGKHKSTIGKEIKRHRILSHKCSYIRDCKLFPSCKSKVCHQCKSYIQFFCFYRDVSPGACNGCDKLRSCRYDKFKYSAETANKEYLSTLIDMRKGVDLTYNEAKALSDIIKPLIDQGQSPYHIITTHPELNICEKTLYNYITSGVFASFGIADANLRIKTKRMPSKDKVKYKKRNDYSYLKGRLYSDFEAYIDENPTMSIVEMDSVYNNMSNGSFIQTFKFRKYGLMIGFYHKTKTSADMVSGLDQLEVILGKEIFSKTVQVILTDRGTEFVKAEAFEFGIDDIRRTRLYYCDPMQSGQKGSIENNHKEFRYICPKKVDLITLGLTDQAQLNKVMSHINSAPKELLDDKTPIELARFKNEIFMNKLHEFGIQEIEKDKVILKPYLLKE